MSPWQPRVSSLGDTLCACRVQCSPSQIPLLSVCTTRVCLSVCVFNEHVWRAPYLWALEIHIVCLSLSLSHTRTQTHTHSHTCCQIRAAAHRVVWSLAWELGRIRQAAAVWYSCHPLSTAGVARHSLKFNQSPPGPKASVYSHTRPLTPTCHTCHSQAIETQTPKPALPIWTPALLFSSRSTTLLSSFHHPTTLLVHSLNNTPSLLGSYVKTIVWTWTSPNCSALCHTETLTWVKANIWHWENHIFAVFLSLVK